MFSSVSFMLNSSLRFLRVIYFGSCFVAFVLYLVLNGFDVLGSHPTAMYVVNLSCIFFTLLGFYVAVGRPRFLYNLLKPRGAENGKKAEPQRWIFVRVLIFSWLLLFNTLCYCLAAYANAPKYCVLISLVLGILIYPHSLSSSNSSEL